MGWPELAGLAQALKLDDSLQGRWLAHLPISSHSGVASSSPDCFYFSGELMMEPLVVLQTRALTGWPQSQHARGELPGGGGRHGEHGVGQQPGWSGPWTCHLGHQNLGGARVVASFLRLPSSCVSAGLLPQKAGQKGAPKVQGCQNGTSICVLPVTGRGSAHL